MRLLMADFQNILGLKGIINFMKGQPIIFYGENLAGKTNIVNALRYSLIPKDPRRRKRTYSEEQRLTKDEMLLSPLEEGKTIVHFKQDKKLYQLVYRFRRAPSGHVKQTQRLYETEAVSVPEHEDKELREFLEGLDWKRLDIWGVNEIANEMIEIGIYPEILDTLIAPSNVRNFSKTINKEIVTIPKVISQTISTIRDTVGKYLKNLKTMNDNLVLEKEAYTNQLGKLQKDLTKISPKEVDKIAKIFSKNIQDNLKAFLKEVESTLERIPDETKNIENLIAELDKDIRDRIKLVHELIKEVESEDEVEDRVEQTLLLEESQTTLERWASSFQNLPSVDNIDAFIEFTPPKGYKKFNYKILEKSEKVQSIFKHLEEGKKLLKQAKAILEKYDVTFENLTSSITSFKKLKTAIESPLEVPEGDEAVISYSEEVEKAQVSVPVDTLMKKPHYMKIHSTPVTHKPRKKIAELNRLVKMQLKALTNTIAELSGAKEDGNKAKKTDQTLKELLPILEEEAKKLEQKRDKNSEELVSIHGTWNQKYGSLCRAFSFKPEKIDLSSKETFKSSLQKLNKAIKVAKENLQSTLKEKLKEFPEVKIKKETTEKEIDEIMKALKQKIKELLETKQTCQEVRDWINIHIEEIQDLEQKLEAIQLLNVLIVALKEIFEPIYVKTDLETITERLAEGIEAEVKEAYQRILADETLKFEHIGKAMFRNTLKDQPITHPSGSQRASISLGIMMALAKTFNLPVILDEATDRYDTNHITTFMEYITALASDPDNPQISLAIYKTMDVEKNPELLSVIKGARIYGIECKSPLNKIIKRIDLISQTA